MSEEQTAPLMYDGKPIPPELIPPPSKPIEPIEAVVEEETPAKPGVPKFRLFCAILMIIAAAMPLFQASVYGANFWRFVNHRSSNPAVVQQSMVQRAQSPAGKAQIRPAVEPMAMFLGIECFAIFILTAVFRKETWSGIRRVATAAAWCFGGAIALQAVLWGMYAAKLG